MSFPCPTFANLIVLFLGSEPNRLLSNSLLIFNIRCHLQFEFYFYFYNIVCTQSDAKRDAGSPGTLAPGDRHVKIFTNKNNGKLKKIRRWNVFFVSSTSVEDIFKFLDSSGTLLVYFTLSGNETLIIRPRTQCVRYFWGGSVPISMAEEVHV